MYILSLKVCQQEFGQRILSIFWSFIVGFKKNHIKICVSLPSQKLSGLKDKEGNYKKYFHRVPRERTPLGNKTCSTFSEIILIMESQSLL